MPPQDALRIQYQLLTKNFNPKRVRIASIVRDTETDILLKQRGLESLRRDTALSGIRSSEAVRQWLQEMLTDERRDGNEPILVFVGHVEQGSYVFYDNKGGETLRLPVSDLRQMAKDVKVELLDLGCGTALTADNTKADGAMVLTPEINSAEAIESMAVAIKNGRTFLDFYGLLASEKMELLLRQEPLKQTAVVGIEAKPVARDGQVSSSTIGYTPVCVADNDPTCPQSSQQPNH